MLGIENIQDLDDKQVIVRVDTDVELDHAKVVDQSRLRAALPTIRYLVSKGANLTLVGHLGRPDGQIDHKLSLAPVADCLAHLLVPGSQAIKRSVSHESSVLATQYYLAKGVKLLENCRFDPGEEANEPEFVSLLADNQDIFVNESFASVHRSTASVVGLAKKLPSYAGFRFIDELAHLALLKDNPTRPFTLVVGGAKVEEKLGLLRHLLPKVDFVLTGGVVANMLLAASGVDTKRSAINSNLLAEAEKLITEDRHKKMIILPEDYVWSGEQIVDIGTETINHYRAILADSQTIFWAGSLGMAEDDRFANGTREIAEYLAKHPGLRIVGGGDTGTALHRFGLDKLMSFVSTGGGAALEYLAGNSLPGIVALN